MKPLVCVRFQETAPLGIIEPVLDGAGIEWRYFDSWHDCTAPDISDISGLIVLGGEMNADQLERYPFLRKVRSMTAEAIDRNVPFFGVCLGAQVMARALGADVRRAPVREIGFQPVKSTAAGMDDPVLAPFAPQSEVFQFHEDECDLPEGAELLFEGTDVRVQAFRFGTSAWGTQFHFEVTHEIIARWCDETPRLDEGWGRSRDDLLDEAKSKIDQQQTGGRDAVLRYVELLR